MLSNQETLLSSLSTEDFVTSALPFASTYQNLASYLSSTPEVLRITKAIKKNLISRSSLESFLARLLNTHSQPAGYALTLDIILAALSLVTLSKKRLFRLIAGEVSLINSPSILLTPLLLKEISQ